MVCLKVFYKVRVFDCVHNKVGMRYKGGFYEVLPRVFYVKFFQVYSLYIPLYSIRYI